MVIVLPSAEWIIQEGLLSVTSELLVNCLFKLAQEKVWLGELTIAIDWEKLQNKQK